MDKSKIAADKVAFGNLVKKHRIAKNYTQEKLASLIGIQPKSVSFIERGINFPAPENIFKIAKILDISLDEFVFGYSKFKFSLTNKELNEMIDSLEDDDKELFIGIMTSVLHTMKERRN